MNYTNDELNLIILDSFGCLSYGQKRTLLSDFTTSHPDFGKYEKILIKSLSCGVYNKVRADFQSEKYRDEVLSGLEKRNVKCVTLFSENYPEKLKEIPIPPMLLYCKGNINLISSECFSIVGSRRTPPNMITICKKCAEEITQHFTVVTGMADGADTAAIEGAMESGKIISVLAGGFDNVYPAMNRQLADKVAKYGLLISEYSPEVYPRKHHFPIRNRIIAGLSVGTLIASAGKKSGALITAHYAEEYGRKVFAFPYGIGAAAGEGCNELIKNNAKLVENTLDIFGEYGLDFKPHGVCSLSEEEEAILAAIRESGEAFITDIAQKLGVLPYMLIAPLSKLEIKGRIVRLGGNRFSAV